MVELKGWTIQAAADGTLCNSSEDREPRVPYFLADHYDI